MKCVVEPIKKQLDPRKAKLYRILFLLGGIGMLGLCGVLIWIFVDRRELPALILGLAAFFWAVALVYQSFKMRAFEAGGGDARGPGGGGTGEP
jgi:uncharacterized membrane protein YqjE